MKSLSLIVSEVCSLKCESCSIMLPFFKQPFTYDYQKVCSWIDLAFDKIDMIGDFTVTGGEPLMNPDLAGILDYLGIHYGNRVGDIKIISNGMILPSQELLGVMEKHGISAAVSDYTKAVPRIRDKVNRTLEAFNERKINYYFMEQAVWVDFGFGHVDNNRTEQQLKAFFDYCRTKCRGYVRGQIWYCINAGFAEQALARPQWITGCTCNPLGTA